MKPTSLKSLGLSDNQITVYLELLKNGDQKASAIARKTPLKRGLVYKILEELENMNLVVKESKAKEVTIFSPIHPNVLKGVAENQINQAQATQKNLENELGQLVSMYNLANNKPGVEFYEGIEGMKKVYNQILLNATAEEGVLSFVKVLERETAPQTHTVLKNYITERVQRNIPARDIAFGDEASKNLRKSDSGQLRETRIIPPGKLPFNFPGGELIICGNTLYLTSLENNTHVTVVITSQSITQLFKIFFYALWDSLE